MAKLQTINRNGLVGEWLLDGNALDTSGSGNNGTATNVTYTNTDRGYQKQTGVFNGSSSKIEYTDSATLSSLSISVWFYADTFSGGRVICERDGNQSYFIQIPPDGHIDFATTTGSGYNNLSTGAGAVLINTWNNIVCTYDGSGKKIYVNNVLITSNSGVSGNIGHTGGQSVIGKYIGANYGWFSGKIELYRIYNRAISTQEIDTLYKEGLRKLAGAGIAPLTDGLVAYYDFNGDANDIFGGNNGTVTGATLTTDRFGNANRAYSFNGTGGVNATSIPVNYDNISFEGWIDVTGVAGNYAFIFQDGYPGTRAVDIAFLNMYGQGFQAHYFCSGGTNGAYSTTSVPSGWTHIAITRSSSGTINFYYNGVVQSKTVISGVGGTINNSTDNFYIGQSNASIGYTKFPGKVGELRMYKRELSSSDILALYQLSSQRYITPLLH